jgi:hypothetical protein
VCRRQELLPIRRQNSSKQTKVHSIQIKRTGFYNFNGPPTTRADINMIAATIANFVYNAESFTEFLEIPAIQYGMESVCIGEAEQDIA